MNWRKYHSNQIGCQIDSKAFNYYIKMEDILFNGNEITFSYQAFAFCSKIKNITVIGSNILNGQEAINYSRSILNITIIGNNIVIGDQSFLMRTQLQIVHVKSIKADIGNDVFIYCKNYKI